MPEADKRRPGRVLFVCVENSCRSQMAEAFARAYGDGQVEAYSAGSKPSGRVNPMAREVMMELGYDMGGQVSKPLEALPDVEFDALVTMGCGEKCPLVPARRREDLEIPDPKAMPLDGFRAVRDLIEEKVKALLDDL